MPRLDHYWNTSNPVSLSLLPLAGLFGAVAKLRRAAYRLKLLPARRFAVPVLVVPAAAWIADPLNAPEVLVGTRASANDWRAAPRIRSPRASAEVSSMA